MGRQSFPDELFRSLKCSDIPQLPRTLNRTVENGRMNDYTENSESFDC